MRGGAPDHRQLLTRQFGAATHQLLGFTLPPRAPQPPTHLPRRSTRRNPNHAVFDRARFVHQFRFVVKPDKGTYSLKPPIASTRAPLGRRLTRLHPSYRLHGPLCGSRYPHRLARRPAGHPPHICVRVEFRRHDQAGSVCRGRLGNEQWSTGVPYLLERTRRS